MKLWRILLLGSLLLIVLSGCFHRKPPEAKANLTFYGLDESDVWEPIIGDYKEKHPSVTIRYKKFNDPVSFENLLVNEIAEGEGPDIFYVHNTWLPRHSKKLLPLQSTVFTEKTFSDTFVQVAADDFIQPDPSNGVKKIYALPLYVDTLAMYYNKAYFEQKLPERGKPANTWDLIKEDAGKFRQEDPETKKLKNGAIALGRADNIARATDILYNLWLQTGSPLYDDGFKQVNLSKDAEKYFDFFLSFAQPQNSHFSWSTDLVSSESQLLEVEAFLSGKVAAIMEYSDLKARFETERKNVKSRIGEAIDLSDIGVSSSPQISTDPSEFAVFANYYGLGVSRNSKNARVSWDFVQFAASQDSLRKYHKETKRPTSRRDLIEEQKKEPVIDVFVSQVGYAKSYRIFSDQEFSLFLRTAITEANEGRNPSQALSQASAKMNALLKTEAPEGLYPKPKKKK